MLSERIKCQYQISMNVSVICGIPECFKRKVQQLFVVCYTVVDISHREQTDFACIITVYYDYVFR